ncbi:MULTISPECIES: hypothetical protein [Streptomycetaceae]|uniref:Heparin binding hemagglutinin HbhA n=1 Tax=Streptantibioticus cattleyicolor (strain ATCC 35852 / DSM 46488 / JCM 4925 / NBRC 14057 / NRRL 8057) TaxID=1003195 RepID=F8K105_STREN|nr:MULTISPECIES: hypothetical protein [Streptomycetaceae]AEW94862.1 hypothetical protein SCATT_24910 [Streptantibioticus cattleyicolor NRRL 8057 = DSM 46488]MYS59480.1 hypothetical protein [Streptomyces sp. SID5468]CCB75216.1 conserved protein of unknown function [Streptantibioticus cattleyicolor NRRL 8057 = DSM 46488]
MAITDNVRKALTDATPLYAAAGTVDLAAEKLREVQPLVEKWRDQAPERLNKLKTADPKVVQERVTKQAKEIQAKITEAIGGVELDLRKFRDTAQGFALQQVGRAAEYAVKAGETYNGLVDRGREAVRGWRGEAAEQVEDIAVAIEPEPASDPAADEPASASGGNGSAARKPATGRKSAPAKKSPAAE